MPEAIDSGVALTWIERVAEGRRETVRDEVAIEEPLEIRVDGRALAVTMRTPGHDEELAVGFLIGEGLIGGADEVVSVGPNRELEANIVEVVTPAGLRRDPFDERRFHMTSSCGVCGKGALEQVRLALPDRPPARVALGADRVLDLPARARAVQKAFDRTGGIHATALFGGEGPEPLVLREDVGRHNAMDKAIGSLALAGALGRTATVACLSGRIGFELVQKAVVAGIGGIVAVGAPTSLAVSLAQEHDLLMCGFVRGGSFNVYAGATQLDSI
ncbi:MAG: formate dehydrogenase accessory sulfurtransferase FdhD [Thermoleophilaceae bacterium]